MLTSSSAARIFATDSWPLPGTYNILDMKLLQVQDVSSASSIVQLQGSCVQFQKAVTLQCLQSKLPGAQALRQHVLKLLDLGLQASAVLSSPQVRLCTMLACGVWLSLGMMTWGEMQVMV